MVQPQRIEEIFKQKYRRFTEGAFAIEDQRQDQGVIEEDVDQQMLPQVRIIIYRIPRHLHNPL